MLKIELKFKDSVLKTIVFDKEVITIGRHSDNDIHIDSLSVSSQHARIVKYHKKYIIEDLDSTNGTFLNKKRISKEKLSDNDVLTIGKHTLTTSFKTSDKDSIATDIVDATMKLTTEEHISMLKKIKKKKK
jgi:pSer/pThr/pTyr-binding forkhead associated (FHA) protein